MLWSRHIRLPFWFVVVIFGAAVVIFTFLNNTPVYSSPQNFNAIINKIRENEKYLTTLLYNEERVLCMILSRKDSTNRRNAVIETWGKRCQILLFFIGGTSTGSRRINSFTQIITLQMQDGWHMTWTKVRLAIAYVNEHYSGKFDWFLRADDDSFVIMDNLRLFLKTRDRLALEMYGVQFRLFGEYVQTGSSLTISALTFDKLITKMNHPNCSTKRTHNDDVELSKCLKLAGVKIVDTRDEKNRFRFFPMNPEIATNRHLIPKWFYMYSKFNTTDGFDCCADDYIGFHYVKAEQMRTLEFLIYYFHPFSGRESWQRPQLK